MTDQKDDRRPLSRREIEEKIIALAWRDDAFRKSFLADPKKQFEEKLGVKLPANLKITAVQEDDNSLTFVIPAKPKGASELSDADLEKVAGGVDILISITLIASAAGASAAAASIGSAHYTQTKAGW
jgi:hypothetical protein